MPDSILDRAHDREMLDQFASLEVGTPEHSVLRDALIERHLPLVHFLARKFADRGEPLDDLVQVGTIGLIKAIDRFDASRGFEFSTYASPTIVGEIKRHFRDKTWAIRVPRRLQELGAAVEKTRTALTHKMGHAPTPAQIAQELNLTLEEVIDAMESQAAYSTVSLDGSVNEDSQPLGDSLGELDAALESIDDRESLKPLLATLDGRAQQILAKRFFDNMSQSAIAQELGMSQMHVSRILAKTLTTLREGMLSE